ncbi:MAG: hypothetical protein K0S53_1709 [Bacteroidetes bacterium]|jgi:hypothetical protein|nr:hypothetical protein [Bacteroidota bacterium]
MKLNMHLKIKIAIFLISSSFFCNSLISNNFETPEFHYKNLANTIRGLEIRYIVLEDEKEKEQSEIMVEGKKYTLYKSKEDAIREVTMEKSKRDYRIVYVISEKKKNTEIVELTD